MTLNEILERDIPLLRAIPEELARQTRPKAGAWTRKQELGHLIDSATNNHVRFVLAATEGRLDGPRYAQDEWVRVHNYQDLPWPKIVDLWYHYNMLLAHLWKQIPTGQYGTVCVVGSQPPVTLEFIFYDYVLHMCHHLDKVLDRYPVTPYPRL